MSSGILAEELADVLWGADGGVAAESHARGVVTAVSGTKVSVRIRGSSAMTCSRIASYSPAVGDVVLVLMMPSGRVVLGKIA